MEKKPDSSRTMKKYEGGYLLFVCLVASSSRGKGLAGRQKRGGDSVTPDRGVKQQHVFFF